MGFTLILCPLWVLANSSMLHGFCVGTLQIFLCAVAGFISPWIAVWVFQPLLTRTHPKTGKHLKTVNPLKLLWESFSEL